MASIHNFERKMECLHAKIKKSDMCRRNKELILDFEKYCAAEGLSLPRRWKLGEYIYVFGSRHYKTRFDRANTDSIWNAVLKIEAANLAPWTKHDFKVAIKKFFKFIEWGSKALQRKDYPDSVAGISTSIKKKDQVRIQAADILTEEEVKQLLAAAKDTQEKAFVSLMYETGARVGEIGAMRIGSISKDNYSYICDVNGKTGPRSSRVVLSAGVLTAWLNLHPRKGDTASPLWGRMRKGKWKPFEYANIQKLMKILSRNAGIKKRVHPHLLRHTRITHVLKNGHLNEAQAKKYFGLTADSDMIATYSHLISKDANDAVLRMYNIKPEKAESKLSPISCGMCGQMNDEENKYCSKCSYILEADAAEDALSRVNNAGDYISKFLSQPEIEQAFRRMVRKEIESALSRSLLSQPSQPSEPSQVNGIPMLKKKEKCF